MPEYPRLTAKEAEKLLLRSGFVLDRQKGSQRCTSKKLIGWFYPVMPEKYCIQKS
jgi:predicted RNA binding protein YcfA (HicA-like mRNA interferase family)